MKVIEYNPEIKKGGCIVRASSIIFDKSCDEVISDLERIGEDFSNPSKFDEYFKQNNLTEIDDYNGKEIDNLNIFGKNIVYVVREDWHHLIAVIDNVIYDKNSYDDLKHMVVHKTYTLKK